MPLQWLPGEPDNADNSEDCIAYVDGCVADINCTELLPFVCYKKSTAMSKPICDTDDEGEPGPRDRCYKLHHEHRTWTQANQICVAEGGQLATIRSREEASYLRIAYLGLVTSDIAFNVIFIGFLDWSGRGDWRTIQGQSLENAGFDDWDSRHLDCSDAGKTCGALQLTNVKLISHWCEHTAPFLCAFPQNSTP
ncbi:macrophage mannose receptor 1-like [Pararge aegeria]|nr:macrophage mannose receptor 1-like [Pararge aegeria]